MTPERGPRLSRRHFALLALLTSAAIARTGQAENPFGVMLGAPQGMALETKMKAAKELGVTYYRPSTAVFTDKWNGSNAECREARRNGLKTILTIRAGSGPAQRGVPEPGHPPADLARYKTTVGEILDACQPAMLVIENEENSMALFYDGSPEDYHRQLKAACEVAHAKGLKCTNGGLVSSLVIALTAEHYREMGDAQKADAFLKRALDAEHYQRFMRGGPAIETQLQRGKALLRGYKAAGADYVNFHWYSGDAEALAEVVRYLETATGLPVLSNEMGQQQNTDPAQVTRIMSKVLELKLPVAVWYSIDTPAFGEAKGLTENDGTLRANGEAFKRFIAR